MLDGSPTRVLVVDDDPMIVATLQEIFGQAGLDHDGAASGSEALAKLSSGHYDAVVLDAVMPDLSGPEVLRRLRKKNHESPAVIYFTAYPDISAYDTYMGGADAVLIKPRPSEELIDTVRYLASRRRRRILKEQDNELKRQRLDHATRRATVEEVTSRLCHDLKNPLAAAGCFLQSIRNDLEKLAGSAACLAKIERLEACLQRINGQIDDISQLPNANRGIESSIRLSIDDGTDVKAAVLEVLAQMRPMAAANDIQLILPELPPDCAVTMPATALQLILKQLVANACEAVLQTSERWLRIDLTEHRSDLQIHVTDSGNGIPEDERGLVMEPFFVGTQKVASSSANQFEVESGNSHPNMGLGLAIARRTAERFGANLSLNEESQQTQFTLTLKRSAIV